MGCLGLIGTYPQDLNQLSVAASLAMIVIAGIFLWSIIRAISSSVYSVVVRRAALRLAEALAQEVAAKPNAVADEDLELLHEAASILAVRYLDYDGANRVAQEAALFERHVIHVGRAEGATPVRRR
ncbi:hypothetical protein [Geodermatophilus obscurus]|uniref:hypothetical protein n=1 Tax=Geodermatophilus obscurus TaxID=1861 RepID=UPI000942E154|nr:hypothetical protein [Geodermatophilus obscurus]